MKVIRIAASFCFLVSMVFPAAAVKVRVTGADAVRQLTDAGGTLIAEYESFSVMEADAAAVAALGDAAEALDDQIRLNAGAVDPSSAEVRSARRLATGFTGKRLHLVQFAGPVKPEWHEELAATGARIVSYIPDNAYLVYSDSDGVTRLQANQARRAYIQWEGAYADTDKIQPGARTTDAQGKARAIGTELFSIQMVADPEANAETLALVDSLKLAPIRSRSENARLGFLNVTVALPADRLADLAARPDVVSIHPYFPPRPFCERQDQIVAGNLNVAGSQPSGTGYLTWLYSKGFTQTQFDASGFIVDIADDGWDNGVAATPANPEFRVSGSAAQPSRMKYSQWGSTLASAGSWGTDGHGNINISIVGGYNDLTGSPYEDASGYNRGLGVCPFANLGNTKVFDDAGDWAPTDEQELQYISSNYNKGVRISSDSWGMPGDGVYDVYAQNYDTVTRDAQPGVAGNQECLFVFAAGNDGPTSTTIGAPGTAKNIISVGAAENYNMFGTDGCAVDDTGADNANDIIDFSSRGPCVDQRKKPDIVAPGTHVQGAASFYSGYTGNGVCDKYQPAGQTNYAASSGTSHSTPAVAGGCALVRQHFINQGWTVPSPAMVKAYLMNAARYLDGVDTGDTLPSNNQGMGMMNLGTAFDGAARILRDQLTNDLFTASGQSRRFYGQVSNTGLPVRVTVGWTDAPGSTSGNAYNNNLDLTVVAGGVTYKGNVFSGAYSTNGGTADARNNSESVFLRAGTTGLVQVTVSATSINSDGVPSYGGALDQDFALVVANATAFVPTNVPPSLDPVGHKTVTTNNLLQFTVSASDTIDNDSIRLWAEGLPPWATFAGATNASTVSSQFSGTPLVTGTYAVTFYAADKDGTNSETITVVANDIYCIPTNIIDEGFDGGTTAPAGWTFTSIGGTYATAGNYGRASPSLKFDLDGDRVETPALNMPSNVTFWIKGQGTDASSFLLVEGYNGSSWSTVGTIVPILTTATTQSLAIAEGISQLRFTYDKSAGNLAFDDVIIAGCGGGSPVNREPTISAAGGTNQTVTTGSELTFVVTVNDADAESVGVYTSAAPAGANFPTVSGTAPIQSTFTWTPAETGTFTAVFVAFDAQVSVTQGVTIVVNEPAPELLPPVIQAATGVQGTQFNANWLASANAAGYRLDVSTNSSFTGSGGATTNLAEDFALFTRTNSSADIGGSLDTYTHTAGWTGTKVYENIGTAKIGSSSAKGYITTPTVNLSGNGGAATVTFDLGKYGTDVNAVQVMHAADGSTFVQVGSDLIPPASMALQTVELTGGTAASKIRITAKGISNNRFYLDNFAIAQGAAGGSYVLGYQARDVGDVTTEPVTGLTENVMYYYRVMAYHATSNSAYSGVTNVLTTAAPDQPPTFTAPASTNQAGTITNLLSFVVSASTAPDADDVTLWAEGVPAWATFATVTNAGGATNTFSGTPPAGSTNVVTFYAGDKDGTNSRAVQIVVTGGAEVLLPPVILAASGVQANQFDANWQASAGATGYRLDVATNNQFRHTARLPKVSSLSPGDLMMVTADADATEGFDVVPLVDLDAGTVIYFTDNGWSNGWRASEGTVTYTAPGAITAGTVLSYRSVDENGFVKSGSFDLSASGDTILAYQGSAGSPQFLYGIGWAIASPWVTAGTVLTANTSEMPSGLSTGAYTIVACGTSDNYQYSSANGTSGTKAELLQKTGTAANWAGNDTTAYAKFTPDFTVSSGGGVNDYVPGYEDRDVVNVTTYGVTGLAVDVMYYYRVRAYNLTSNSVNSAVTNVLTTAAGDIPPTFTAPASTNQAGTITNLLSFVVSASTAPDADDVTLWAEGVPAWATFATVTNAGGVTNTFSGTPPAGSTNVVTFYAGDKDGTNSLAVQVIVTGGAEVLLPPIVQAASNVDTNQFDANWLASAGATGYRLDVATNNQFRHTARLPKVSSLSPGDLMIVTVDADDPEGFDVVPLVDLDAGTVIYFTDNGWSNGWRASEGIVTYTAPGAVTAGTVLSYRSVDENGFVKTGASFALAAAGDTILAYQGSAESPQFLYGAGWAIASPWVADGTALTANNSCIPSSLSTGAFTIVSCGSFDNQQYNSASGTTGTKSALLQLVANAANWSGSDATAYAKFTPDFTVSSGGGVNDYVPGYENRDVANVTTYGVTGLAVDVMYYYRVRAYNATTTTANSATTNVLTAAPSGTPPVLNAIGNQSVGIGSNLHFAVTATATEADTVTLTASNLPAGAFFYPTNELASFVWDAASPTGTYTVTFNAADNDGSDEETITITVNGLPVEEPDITGFAVPAGATAAATLTSVNGQSYTLEYTTDLGAKPPVWTPADTKIGDGGAITLSDPTPADMLRIYRIVTP